MKRLRLCQLYNANHDPQLLNRRTWVKNLCMDYNQLRWDEGVKRTALLQELLGICGEDAVIEPPFFVDYGKNICIGRSFYANHNLVILDGATVTIGNNVFIGPNCTISTAGHPFEARLRGEGLEYAKAVTIGNNVWIGMGVQICPGVTIGDNAVIGARQRRDEGRSGRLARLRQPVRTGQGGRGEAGKTHPLSGRETDVPPTVKKSTLSTDR